MQKKTLTQSAAPTLTFRAGLIVSQFFHTTFGPVGVGLGVYCVAVAATLALEKRNGKNRLVFVSDLYTNTLVRSEVPESRRDLLKVEFESCKFEEEEEEEEEANGEEAKVPIITGEKLVLVFLSEKTVFCTAS